MTHIHHWWSPFATGPTSIETCLICWRRREVANSLPCFENEHTYSKHCQPQDRAVSLACEVKRINRRAMSEARV